jgi:antitoxin component YwqK of YwqJK toxin-antitoxin module
MEMAFMEHREPLAVRSIFCFMMFCCSCHHGVRHQQFSPLKWFEENTLQLQNENGVFTQNGIAFSGTVYSLADNKKDTVAVGSFVNGKEDGEWRKYFSCGLLMERRFYKLGKKTGIFHGWWPNGYKRLTYHFQNGEYEGNCRDWTDKGVLINDMNYHEGHETGEQKQFYEDGKIKSNYVIKDGRRYGLLGTKNCVNVSDSVFR